MAVVLPLLLLLFAGAADFGRAFNNYIIITNASREGARMASHFPYLPGWIRDAAKLEAANSGLTLEDGNIFIDPDPASSPALSGEPVRVSVQYTFQTLIAGLFDPSWSVLTLGASTEMVVFGVDQ
jgi:hypothetical protein